ncbi:MAG: hypothetical protein LAT81_15090, partial [Oceanicaulis sp.]|nr:hypothetical protein [Oceanicaulis sp.]
MTLRMLAAGAAGLVAVCAADAHTQTSRDSGRDIRLSAGSTPDPYRVDVTAGGPVRATDLVRNATPGQAGDRRCRGNVSERPAARLDFRAGPEDLTVTAEANFDTTLVVRGPDGTWYCDDDSGRGNIAALAFTQPRSGVYEIWVGAYSGIRTGETAALLISAPGDGRERESGSVWERALYELLDVPAPARGGARNESPSPTPGRGRGGRRAPALDPDLAPRAGAFRAPLDDFARSLVIDTTLATHERVDEALRGVSPGNAGDRRCRGSTGTAPDASIDITRVSQGRRRGGALVISADADFDTTLAVLAPDGTWFCDD